MVSGGTIKHFCIPLSLIVAPIFIDKCNQFLIMAGPAIRFMSIQIVPVHTELRNIPLNAAGLTHLAPDLNMLTLLSAHL